MSDPRQELGSQVILARIGQMRVTLWTLEAECAHLRARLKDVQAAPKGGEGDAGDA